MRILLLGAGAIGGYFGGRLAAAHVDVTFLVRPERQKKLAQTGLIVRSPLGDLVTSVATVTQAGLGFDAIILACKAYDLAQAAEAIAPAVGDGTVILPLLNGLSHLDVLDARFGSDRVLGGLCHIGVRLEETGEISHLNRLEHLSLGARTPGQGPVARALHETLRPGGFDPILSPSILQAMWEKYVFLAAYAGMTCLMRGSIGAIMQAADGEKLMRAMILECIAVAAASGYPLSPTARNETMATLTEKGSTGTASMLRDVLRNGRTEHEHLIGDMVRRAEGAGLEVPLLRTALAHLQTYEAMRMAGR
ncbi:MAG: ketopantoate reductase family protein [Acidovorax sp.]